MLSLDHYHHAFTGQRQLINVKYCFPFSKIDKNRIDYLDSTLPYRTSSTNYINTAHIISCRAKVGATLEHFFETYAQRCENPRHTIVSNKNFIRLNTFLLLILRLVHVTITAAETSETPGTRLDMGLEQIVNSSTTPRLSNWKKPFYDLAKYIGLRPSCGKFVRAIKTSLSVLVSTIVVLKFRERLQAYGWVY